MGASPACAGLDWRGMCGTAVAVCSEFACVGGCVGRLAGSSLKGALKTLSILRTPSFQPFSRSPGGVIVVENCLGLFSRLHIYILNQRFSVCRGPIPARNLSLFGLFCLTNSKILSRRRANFLLALLSRLRTAREPPRRMPTHQPPRVLTDSSGVCVVRMRKPVRAEQVAPPALVCGC